MKSDLAYYIYCLQPRRLGATELAARVANLDQTEWGDKISYCIGGERPKQHDGTRLIFVTVQWFIEKMRTLDELPWMTHLFLDEVHERSEAMDLAMWIAYVLLQLRPQLRVVLMSATMNWHPITEYFEPFISKTVCFPLKFSDPPQFTLYECFLEDVACGFEGQDMTQEVEGIKQRIKGNYGHELLEDVMKLCVRFIRHIMIDGISVLVFLPGIVELQTMRTMLEELDPRPLIMFLHSHMQWEDRAVTLCAPEPTQFKIILASDVAQSSVTPRGVRYVLDFGLQRRQGQSTLNGEQILSTGWISKHGSRQRKGRAGRLSDGVYCLLVPKEVYDNGFPEEDNHTLSDTEFCHLLLRIADAPQWGPIEMVCEFLLNPPPIQNIREMLSLLEQEQAIRSDGLTSAGRFMLQTHLPVRAAKMVLVGCVLDASVDVVLIAAAVVVRELFNESAMESLSGISPEQMLAIFSARKFFDAGHFSDHFAFRNVLLAYLTGTMQEDHLLNKDSLAAALNLVQHLSACVLRSFYVGPGSKTVLERLAKGVSLSPPSEGAIQVSIPVLEMRDVLGAVSQNPHILKLLVVSGSAPLFLVSSSQSNNIPNYAVQFDKLHDTLKKEDSFRGFLDRIAPGSIASVGDISKEKFRVQCTTSSAREHVSDSFLPRPNEDLQKALPACETIKVLAGCKRLALPDCNGPTRLAEGVSLAHSVTFRFLDHVGTKCNLWGSNSMCRVLSTPDKMLAAASHKIAVRRQGENCVRANPCLMTLLPLEGAALDFVFLLMTLSGPYRVLFFKSGIDAFPDYAHAAELRDIMCGSSTKTVVSFKPFLVHPTKLLELLNQFRMGIRDFFISERPKRWLWFNSTRLYGCNQIVDDLQASFNPDASCAKTWTWTVNVMPRNWTDKVDEKAMVTESPLSIWGYVGAPGEKRFAFADIDNIDLKSEEIVVWSSKQFIDHVAQSMQQIRSKAKFELMYHEVSEIELTEPLWAKNGDQACQPRAIRLPIVAKDAKRAYPNGEEVTDSNSVIFYHGTNFSYIPRILLQGLKGAAGHGRWGAWCRPTLDEALTWKMDTLLDTVPCTALKISCHKEYVQKPNNRVGASAYTIAGIDTASSSVTKESRDQPEEEEEEKEEEEKKCQCA